ncbi:MAG: carbohydrate kinase family protein [Nitrososphaerales archaeon]|nr:carbohydrate kinase family protein [Nitrososphaerales archaeon]
MAQQRYDAAVMHDFFVDRLVHVQSLDELLGLAKAKSREGGGSIHDVEQEEVIGGNAVNMAHALGELGAKVLLITHSDAEHEGLLRKAFKRPSVKVRIKPQPPGLTVALEESVNVMVSDSGGAARFPPRLLTEDDWESLKRSRIVCSVNWAANAHGTELLITLRRNLGEKAVLYLATSDVRDRRQKYADLIARMRRRRLVDWLSVNEDEARSTIKALGIVAPDSRKMCRAISDELGIRVDVHAERASYTALDGDSVELRTDHVKPKRRTGAGDVWDAGSVYAFLKGMRDEQRLAFANAAAKLYLLSENVAPPSLWQVARLVS